jgi:hypothetical protein
MASRKNSSGNRLDVGWQHGIDIHKNSRKFSASIVKKLLVEVFFVLNSIWLALVRMLSHVSKYQKMLSR